MSATRAALVRLTPFMLAIAVVLANSVGPSGAAFAAGQPPQLTVGGTVTYVVSAPATVLDPTLTVTGSDPFPGATVSIGTNFNASQDRLGIQGQPGTSGTVSGLAWSYNTTTGVLTLSGSAAPSTYEAVLRQVTYYNISPSPTTAPRSVDFSLATQLPFSGNGHFYEFVPILGITWHAARNDAATRSLYGMQGYLATITTSSENSFIFNKLQGNGWLGGSDELTEGTWRWVTGPENGTVFCIEAGSGVCNSFGGAYVNFASGEPNNCCLVQGEDYLHMIGNPAIPGLSRWNDLYSPPPTNAYNPRGYVVEYGGTPGDPILQLTGSVTVNVIANLPPTIASNNSAVTVNEGQTATVSGSYSDPNAGDNVSISASVGTVTKTGTSSGSWTWSYPTTDGPDQSATVVLTANDGHGQTAATSIALTVNNVAPTVTITGPTTVNEGTTHSYTITATDPGNDTLTLIPGDTNCLSGAVFVSRSFSGNTGSIVCSFPDGPDPTVVTAQVNDSDGAGTDALLNVMVNNVAPTITLSGPTTANEGETKTYTFSVSDPGQDTYTVNANCGVGGTLVGSVGASSFDCTFLDGPANVAVSASATDSDNTTGNTATVNVAVSNVAPTVTLSGPTSTDEGNTETYTFTVSDPGQDTFTPNPNCGAGGSLVAGSVTASSFDCLFPDGPATPTVSLTGQDSDGTASNTATVSVTVNNVTPTVTLTGPTSVNEGETHTYAITVSDPGQDDLFLTGDTFCLSPAVFISKSLSGTSGTLVCSFPDGPASAFVQAEAVDSDGAFSDASDARLTVTIHNIAPTITASGASNVDEGSPYTVTLGNVVDPGQDTVTAYTIHWGDGNSDSFSGSANGATATHTYADGPNNYTITVDLTDEDGTHTAAGSTSVTVDNVAPTADAGADQTEFWGLPVPFTGSATDPGTVDTTTGLNPTWTFGDGPATASGYSVAHVYADPGSYTATLTVTDKDGASDSDDAQATINKRGTSLTYTGDTTSIFGFAATLSAQLTDVVDAGTALLGGRTVTITINSTTFTTTTDGSGVATVTAPALLMPGTYPISIAFAEDGHYLASTAQGSLTVLNSAGKVTGGGLRTANNGRGGFNVQSDGSSVKGELQFQATGVNFHAPTLTALGISVDGTKAWFAGIGRDGQAFVAYTEDNGEPGRNDRFQIWIASALQNGTGAMSGGNIQIHQ